MTKHILLLAAVLGFIAQSSVFAADPTPSPSASPKAHAPHHHKHHKKSAAPSCFAFSDSQSLLRPTRSSQARSGYRELERFDPSVI